MLGIATAKRLWERLADPYEAATRARRAQDRAEADAHSITYLYEGLRSETERLRDRVRELEDKRH